MTWALCTDLSKVHWLTPTSTTQQEEEQALEHLQTTVREEVSTTYFRNDEVPLMLQDILMTLL